MIAITQRFHLKFMSAFNLIVSLSLKENVRAREREKEQPKQIGRFRIVQNFDNPFGATVAVEEEK